MTQVWLVADSGNEHIDALLAGGDVPIDGLKVGPRQGDEQIAAVASTHTVMLHISDGVIWPRRPRWVATQVRLARLVRAPWVSVHLDLGWTFLAYHWPGPSPIPAPLARQWAIRTLQLWASQSDVPLLAENMPRWSRARPAYTVDPAFITDVIRQANCHLLLDLAHARTAAAMRQQPVREYITQLPLDRLIEIHVSGPRPSAKDGRLIDAHQPLQEEDYALLAWVLERTRPRAVTLEYWRDRSQLHEQLFRLQRLLSAT